VDIWQASSNGKYDFQDPEAQTDNNLRGKFRTDEKGEYWFYCLRPTAYSLPTDGKSGLVPIVAMWRQMLTRCLFSGPAGTLLKLLDRHPMRPAHIHLMVSCVRDLQPTPSIADMAKSQITHPNSKPVTTQIFPADDPYLSTDSVFAVKNDLVVTFNPLKPETQSSYQSQTQTPTPNSDSVRADGIDGKVTIDRELGPRHGKPTLDLEYNVILAPKDMEGASNVPLAPGGVPTGDASMKNGAAELVNGNH
jgi:protocatechuate 3,4-dioxygenase beta subunit